MWCWGLNQVWTHAVIVPYPLFHLSDLKTIILEFIHPPSLSLYVYMCSDVICLQACMYVLQHLGCSSELGHTLIFCFVLLLGPHLVVLRAYSWLGA